MDVEQGIRHRRFDLPAVWHALDAMMNSTVVATLGKPVIVKTYHEPLDWRPGDKRPLLADDDPAVMQAIGRCLASRVRGRLIPDTLGAIHPLGCGWDDYPKAELLSALGWAAWQSRFVVSRIQIWQGNADAGTKAPEYFRGLAADYYENPRWAAFWALPSFERARRIDEAIVAGRPS